MEKLKNRPCGKCGSSSIKEVNLKNSWVNEPWKDYPRVFITCDAIQLKCSDCGAIAGSRSSAKIFDAAARESIRSQVSYFINRIKKRTRLPLKTIAERIPMGYQHLSDLKNSRSFPSYHYWSLLFKINKDPDLLDRLDSSNDEEPPVSLHG